MYVCLCVCASPVPVFMPLEHFVAFIRPTLSVLSIRCVSEERIILSIEERFQPKDHSTTLLLPSHMSQRQHSLPPTG